MHCEIRAETTCTCQFSNSSVHVQRKRATLTEAAEHDGRRWRSICNLAIHEVAHNRLQREVCTKQK
jgi:hypothetical protein